jgi:RNA polymerase sigma-70 factor (ECF subfamily)
MTDEQLVARADRGDARAWEDLFDRHYEGVYRLAYRCCGVREEAEDIAQEVFVKLLRKLGSFRGRSAFRTWLYRITVNTARDALRSRSKALAREEPIDAEGGGPEPDCPPRDVLAAVRIQGAVDRLPEGQREAFALVLGEGLSHREAAEALGCMEATVSWRIFQAVRRLRDSLGGEG